MDECEKKREKRTWGHPPIHNLPRTIAAALGRLGVALTFFLRCVTIIIPRAKDAQRAPRIDPSKTREEARRISKAKKHT